MLAFLLVSDLSFAEVKNYLNSEKSTSIFLMEIK